MSDRTEAVRCQVGDRQWPRNTHEKKKDGLEARAGSLKPVWNSCVFVG